MHRLLQEASRGCDEARGRLVERFAGDVRRFIDRRAGRLLRRHVSSADLCQETFLRVFRGLSSLPDDADLGLFRGRLLKTAGWVVAQRAEEAKRFAGESVLGEDFDAAQVPGPAPATGPVTGADELGWLEALCDRLSPRYRDVVRARLRGLRFDQIAGESGEQVEAVRKRFYRACHELKRLVEARSRREP